MAVSDWSTNPVNNISINGYSLSGPYGHVFAVMMAELKAELDSIKASVTAVDTAIGDWATATPARTTKVKAAIEALEGAMGAWTTEGRTTTVKAAVEGVEGEIGAWTDTTETTTVKAAIEALRPEGE